MNGILRGMAAGLAIGLLGGMIPAQAADVPDTDCTIKAASSPRYNYGYTYCTIEATPSDWPSPWYWQLWWRKGNSGNYELAKAWGGDWAFTQDTPINKGETYSFVLIVYGPDDQVYGDWTKTSTYNSIAKFTPKIPPPQNVQASDGTSQSSITITWDAVAGMANYQIWWSTNSNVNTATRLDRIMTNRYTTSWDQNVRDGILYYFWIKAAPSNDYDDTTEFSVPDSGYRGTLVKQPLPPGNVSASDGSYTDHVSVSWNAAADATGYQVWRGTNATTSSAALVARISGKTNYNDSAVSPGIPYYYWVKSTNSLYISAFSSYDTGFARAIMLTGFDVTPTEGGTSVKVTGKGAPGKTYALYWTTDLADGWNAAQQAGETSAAADGVFSIVDDVEEEGPRFYQVLEKDP